MIKKIANSIIMVILVICALTVLSIPFAHPDMTRTRLLIEFWHLYLCVVVTMFSVMFIHKKINEKS